MLNAVVVSYCGYLHAAIRYRRACKRFEHIFTGHDKLWKNKNMVKARDSFCIWERKSDFLCFHSQWSSQLPKASFGNQTITWVVHIIVNHTNKNVWKFTSLLFSRKVIHIYCEIVEIQNVWKSRYNHGLFEEYEVSRISHYWFDIEHKIF